MLWETRRGIEYKKFFDHLIWRIFFHLFFLVFFRSKKCVIVGKSQQWRWDEMRQCKWDHFSSSSTRRHHFLFLNSYLLFFFKWYIKKWKQEFSSESPEKLKNSKIFLFANFKKYIGRNSNFSMNFPNFFPLFFPTYIQQTDEWSWSDQKIIFHKQTIFKSYFMLCLQ